MELENFKKLYSLISERNPNYVESRIEVEISFTDEKDSAAVTEELHKLNIDSEEHYGNLIRFNFRNLNYSLFWNLDDFRTRVFAKDEQSIKRKFEKDLAIIKGDGDNDSGKPLFYDATKKITYLDFEETQNIFLFPNAEYYLKFLAFLKSREHKEDGFFHFVDHFSWDHKVIVFVSATKEGKVTVPFQTLIPKFELDKNLKDKFIHFFEAFDETDKTQKLPKFIKSELFNQLSSEIKENRLMTWINKMDEILENAQQNFDIYLSNLSMENIKKHYLETKDRYFVQLREILSKIASQIIALPISISVVALATFTIPTTENKIEIVWFLIAAFIVYTFFSLFILKLYRGDIEEAKEQYKRDFESLEAEEFFKKYTDQLEYFNDIKLRLNEKIETTRKTLYAYIALLITTHGILLYKLLSEVNFYPIISVFFVEILFILFLKVDFFNLLSSE